MKQIVVHPKGYFKTCEGSIRFCHVENGELKYLIFPFWDVKARITAATILRDCGIIDDWKEVKLGEALSYVELFQWKFRTHKDRQGFTFNTLVKSVIQWTDLKLTEYDCKHFIARFELMHPELPTVPKKVQKQKVIQMPAWANVSKRIA